MKKDFKKSTILLLAVISVVGLVVTYLYLNPTIDDPDFHLEYEIANGKKICRRQKGRLSNRNY